MRSSNPYSYVRFGYFLDNAEMYGGRNSVDYNGDISECVAAVITDIEMPQMDGHHLTKLIKSDSKLKKIPVFLFSSLINEQMYKKGLSVGADEQFSKPQIGMLIERLMQILS